MEDRLLFPELDGSSVPAGERYLVVCAFGECNWVSPITSVSGDIRTGAQAAGAHYEHDLREHRDGHACPVTIRRMIASDRR